MASERKIYCHYCDAYCGTIRDASLMKGLIYTCVSCQEPADGYSSKNEDSGSWDDALSSFGNIFGDVFTKKKK